MAVLNNSTLYLSWLSELSCDDTLVPMYQILEDVVVSERDDAVHYKVKTTFQFRAGRHAFLVQV